MATRSRKWSRTPATFWCAREVSARPSGAVVRSIRLLAELLQREDLLFGPQRVKRGETPCLGVCSNGPIVVVYPDGIWYADVTPRCWSGSSSNILKHGHGR